MEPHIGRLELIVRKTIELRGIKGATCDEIEHLLALSHQTTSARCRRLAVLGRIVDSGERRKTRSGRNAVVWRVAP